MLVVCYSAVYLGAAVSARVSTGLLWRRGDVATWLWRALQLGPDLGALGALGAVTLREYLAHMMHAWHHCTGIMPIWSRVRYCNAASAGEHNYVRHVRTLD